MENRPKGCGLTAEAISHINSRYDPYLEMEVRAWMELVVGEPVCLDIESDEPLGPDRLHEALKDGIYLCKLAMAVTGNSIKYNTSKMSFKMVENISKFVQAAEDYCVTKLDFFQTMDLYEKTNMPQVVAGLYTFGKKAYAKGASVPRLGPEES